MPQKARKCSAKHIVVKKNTPWCCHRRPSHKWITYVSHKWITSFSRKRISTFSIESWFSIEEWLHFYIKTHRCTHPGAEMVEIVPDLLWNLYEISTLFNSRSSAFNINSSFYKFIISQSRYCSVWVCHTKSSFFKGRILIFYWRIFILCWRILIFHSKTDLRIPWDRRSRERLVVALRVVAAKFSSC